MPLRTSKEAHDFGLLLADDYREAQQDDPLQNFKQTLQQKREIFEKLRGSANDYKKFELLGDILKSEEELELLESRAKQAELTAHNQCYHDRSLERQLYQKPTIEKLNAAKRFRELGNQAFKARNYADAVLEYRKALIQFEYTFPQSPEEDQVYNQSKIATHLNMALCKYHLKEWDEVLTHCRLALVLDPTNLKALYRRALTYQSTHQYDLAEEALNELCTLDPSSDLFVRELNGVRAQRKFYEEKKKKVFAAMFSGAFLKGKEIDKNEHEIDPLLTQADSTAAPQKSSVGPPQTHTEKLEPPDGDSESQTETQLQPMVADVSWDPIPSCGSCPVFSSFQQSGWRRPIKAFFLNEAADRLSLFRRIPIWLVVSIVAIAFGMAWRFNPK